MAHESPAVLDDALEYAAWLARGRTLPAVHSAPPRADVAPDVPVDALAPRTRMRARTISVKRLSKRELWRGTALYPTTETARYDRPLTRADCLQGENAARPCPFVSCKHHLYLDVNERSGAIKFNFPDLEVWEMPESCALDIADRGGITLEEIGVVMNLTRERIRQLETRGLGKLRRLAQTAALADHLDGLRRLDPVTQQPVPLDARASVQEHDATDALRRIERDPDVASVAGNLTLAPWGSP